MNEKFLKPYSPKEAEDNIYKLWEDSGFFNPDVCIEKKVTKKDAESFSIVLPPPNVTGTLHMGHAAMLVVEDIMIRFNRMLGKKTLWLPGTDHAAIATQSKVESIIYKKEKKTRHDLGREEFLKRVEQFAKESHAIITKQVKKMGSSVDWSREAFTLDEKRNFAVRTAFKRMYDDDLIYQGARIVNWDPKMQTTVSDDEVVRKEEKSIFYYLKYGPFTIATARPETKFGDKYVVMHPEDKRYQKYEHGQTIELEWINGPITATIIKDEAIDMKFGTGVMTITPWHDTTDFEIAERHNLDKEQIIDFKGLLLPVAGEFVGQHIKKARPLIVEKLKEKGLLVRVDENYVHSIATNDRGGGIIEPQIKKQWFVNVNKTFTIKHSSIEGIRSGQQTTLKEIMKTTVKSGQIEIIPEYFKKTYFHWIDNLQDWCISRQIWYGHQIPVWYKTNVGSEMEAVHFNESELYKKLKVKNETEFNKFSDDLLLEKKEDISWAKSKLGEIQLHQKYINVLKDRKFIDELWVNENKIHRKVGKSEIYCDVNPPKEDGWQQDPDTLDTWFSSGLWTFSTLGWPEETEDLRVFHPTNVLETGYDILFFWVARMILMSGYHVGDIPFKKIYLHGLVRDEKGRKMSKSLGNGIEPLLMIEKYGADSSRMSLIIGAPAGSDITLSEDKIKGYKHFANKIWNVTRFVLSNTENADLTAKPNLRKEDEKTIAELEKIIEGVTHDIEHYSLYLAAEKIYHYFWHAFADVIIEESKSILEGEDKVAKASVQWTLYTVLTTSLKLLHPFMPFVTEEIWQSLPQKDSDLLMVSKWPTVNR